MIGDFFLRRRIWFRVMLGLAAGALLSLAFPPADVRWVAFVALVPLLLALRGASGVGGVVVGLAFGSSFFGLVLLWLSTAGWIAWGAVMIAQVPFAIAFGWLGALLSRGGVLGRVAGAALLFTGIELARAHVPLGGFSFGSLGSSQHGGAPLLPLARAGGMWSVTLLLVVINALLAEALTARRRLGRVAGLGVAVAAAVGPAFLPLGAEATGRLDVAVVQGNVPPNRFADIARGRTGPEDEQILRNHVMLTETLVPAPPDLVVWPENALDRDPFADPTFGAEVSRVVSLLGRPALIGTIMEAPGGRFYNANLLIASDGTTIIDRYDKMHLVPFGEYVPWAWARRFVRELDQVPSDGIPGRAARVLGAPGARIGAVICFESSYPDLVRRFVRNGAELIVVSTNNATFRRSPLARQHLAQSKMRAVETGRTVVHAAISGISAIIGPDGRVQETAGLFRPAIVRGTVPLSSERTPYAAYGDTIDLGLALGGAAAALVALLLGIVRRRPASGAAGGLPDDEADEFHFWQGAPVTGSVPAVEPAEPRSYPAAGDDAAAEAT